MSEDYIISDYNYMASSIGNAFFSGVEFNELWDCINMSQNREELDAAVSATIKLKEISTKGEYNE